MTKMRALVALIGSFFFAGCAAQSTGEDPSDGAEGATAESAYTASYRIGSGTSVSCIGGTATLSNGILVSCVLANTSGLWLQGPTSGSFLTVTCKANQMVSFHPSGSVAGCTLNNVSGLWLKGPTSASSLSVTCQSGLAVSFYDSGSVAGCTLNNVSGLWKYSYGGPGTTSVTCASGKSASFQPTGSLGGCTLANTSGFPSTGGGYKTCSAGKVATFDAGGYATNCS